VLNGYACQMCENRVGVTQKTTLERAPIVYCFYVKDFGMAKNKLKYPEKFEETVRTHKLNYNLTGILVHQGPNRLSGHFTAYIKSPSSKLWYLCDDDTVKMSNWETVSHQPVLALFYQKDGNRETADRQSALLEQQLKKDVQLQTRIQEAHQLKLDLDSQERKRGADNTMTMEELETAVESETNTKKQISLTDSKSPAANDALGKRKPLATPVKFFKPERDPKLRLRRLKRFGSLLPKRVEPEKDVHAVNIHNLDEEDPLKLRAWNIQGEAAINALKQENRFMLGQIVRQRDEYDVEYDKGKTKKVKKEKQERRFNFDKAEKKIKKLKDEGKYLPRKSRK
jgi:Ubiquitin carboxyl-terminal hydrolase